MALRCREKCVAAGSWAAVIMLVALLGGELATAIDCPSLEDQLVYPYWSICWSPAQYFGEEVYVLEGARGKLAPEWDDSNSTYYIRAAEVGARYKLVYWISRELRPDVAQHEDLGFVNVASGMGLTWRQEGENEWFLVEGAGTPALFKLAAAPNVPLPCPRIAGARCEAYYILNYGSNSTFGLGAYVEDNATYLTRALEGSNGLPFLLRRSVVSTTSYSLPA